MKFICIVKYATLLHVTEDIVKEIGTSSEQVPPKPLDPLVVHTSARDVAAPIRSSQWMR